MSHMSLQDLIAISNYYGENPDFVLAGGGNTSYKTDKFLYIKGSGTTLADIKEAGFVKMNRVRLGLLWTKEYPMNTKEREDQVLTDLMDAREKTEYTKRPSVETSLHDIMKQKFVVHTHPALINGLTCSKDGAQIAKQLFGEKVIWIPSQNPGYILATIVKEKIDAYILHYGVDPQIIFLENHGIFLAADTIEEIKTLTDDVVQTLKTQLLRKPNESPVEFDREKAAKIAPAIRMLLMEGGNNSIVTFRTNVEVCRLVASPEAFIPVSSSYTPDHIVYCKFEPLFVEATESIEEQYILLERAVADYKTRNGFLPKIIAIQYLGYFAWGTGKKAADIAADVFMDAVKISVYTESFKGYHFMSQAQIDFINNWEVESYRTKISLASDNQKRLLEKIVIVTGSAQGFGKGIAEEMAREGANIVIADLNDVLGCENASNLCRTYGKGRAIAVKVNVGDEPSVNDMIINTVLEYGGLDILVNNAGVLRAGGLEEMDVKSFEFVTKINYTAYYLCTKFASRPMKIQNKYCNNYFMDIIQINSKSGLEGSNKNFAYAGGKFGGIGLTQSFALELVEYNIKVNSICPGNFFDGPLWADPEKGLFVQYLKAGKVPGAKTVMDVKRFYEAKVPMKRGTFEIDVARAIFYVVEQTYETGQAVPVTGGQVMLN